MEKLVKELVATRAEMDKVQTTYDTFMNPLKAKKAELTQKIIEEMQKAGSRVSYRAWPCR
jgi:methionyl-tRNA synthetase